MPILVLKVALLLRAQRYDKTNNIIDLQDVKDAIILIKRTWFDALPITRGINNNEDPFIGRLEGYIRGKGEVDRTKLMRQGHFTASELREGLSVLVDEGKIQVFLGKEVKSYPGTNSKEVYKWCGERWLGTGSEGEEDE